jgi:CHAT domain-containing protein
MAYTVFNALFPTNEIKELIATKKLTIVPDSYLALLPFEALNTKEKTLDYLINESETSYLYSYSFLHNQHSTQSQNRGFLGVAPNTFNYEGLSPLDNSEDEILNLDNYFKGSILINEKATKKEFLKQLSNYNIIHLATHANAQDSINPWIAFRNEKLTLPELYLTNNSASLVVLSGCNTTLGKEEIGEGIMSLARGFFYSGSQSVISSLWSVDNTSTPILMNDFYKNLHNGQTKSESMHNAKLNYLENHSLSEASPHYWASFILLGDDAIVENTTNQWLFFLYLFFAILLVLLVFKLSKKFK